MGLERDLHQREKDLQRDKANQGGPAAAFALVHTTGNGPIAFAKRIDFGLTFIEEPFPQYGAMIDLDDVSDAGFAGDPPAMPQSTGYVTDWDQDDHGNYTGCWVAVMVTYPPTDDDSPGDGPAIAIRHYFTFQAVAIKDLSDTSDDPVPG